MRKIFFISVSLLLLASFDATAANVSLSQVVLRGLDKVTGRLSTMTVNVGTMTHFGALDVYVRVCYARPPEEVPENTSFLEIVEKKPEGEAKVFSGWMFSSSPALSAMEHPVYDVWVLKCQGNPFKAPIPEPLVLKNPVQNDVSVQKLKVLSDGKKSVSDVSVKDETENKEKETTEKNVADAEEESDVSETSDASESEDAPVQEDETAETDETIIITD